jgi:decaprenyl-phosphate phosphoribosyltransferase
MTAHDTVTSAPPARRLAVPPLVAALRPRQWVKNVLVLAGPAAAEVLSTREGLLKTLVAFVAFCGVSSAVYLGNDIVDREADARHPVKRTRPIAAGLVSVRTAWTTAILLTVGSFALGALTGEWLFLVVLAVYLLSNVAYNAGLKHVAIIDLVIVASGFLLRAIGGAVAVGVTISSWFLIVTSFGSLFVVTGKRLAELEELGEDAADHRPTLEHYTVPFLRFVLGVACTGTALAYCIFSFDRADVAAEGAVWFQLSAIPVVTALLRYALAIEAGEGSAPEDVFLRDRPVQILGAIWAVLFAMGLILD